jgi:hypothetical protein
MHRTSPVPQDDECPCRSALARDALACSEASACRARAFVCLRQPSYFLFACSRMRRSACERRSRPEGRRAGCPARSKEGTPREHALRPSMGCGFASGRRGSPKAHPCTCGELARMTRHIHVTRPSGRLRHSNRQSCRFSLRAILRTFPSAARRVRGAPVGAHDSPHPCGSPFGSPAEFKSAAVLPIWSVCVAAPSKLHALASN